MTKRSGTLRWETTEWGFQLSWGHWVAQVYLDLPVAWRVFHRGDLAAEGEGTVHQSKRRARLVLAAFAGVSRR